MNTDFTTKDLNRSPTAFQQQPLPQTLYPLQTQEQWDRLPKGKLKPEDVFEAFYRCKAGKADTCNALRFEMHFERYCLELCERVNNHNYHPDRSIVFIIEKPVKREVFAPSFESRVGDHVVADKIMPLLDAYLLDDNYATRSGRGTLYGVRRVEAMMEACTEHWTKECWVMKTDLESFFMSLDKRLLYSRIAWFVDRYYHGEDKMELIYLLWAIIMDRPETHCVRRCPRNRWEGLPPRKSLFNSDGRHGIPIGRMTSQMSVSLYLDELDKLLRWKWHVPFVGRYVDDIVMMSQSKEVLYAARHLMEEWLHQRDLNLHPRKLYLQPYRKGVNFVGGFILPGRIYATRRSIGFAFDAVAAWNRLAMNGSAFVEEHAERMASTLNSYLGHLRHFAAYNVRRRLLDSVDPAWWEVLSLPATLRKVAVRRGHTRRDHVLQELSQWERQWAQQ